MIRWKRKTLLCAFVIWTAFINQPVALKAQRYIIGGWPIKKTWGPVRATYFDIQHRELRMVFEDAAGTVRIGTINPDAQTAVPVCEMKRK
jgi:hypothetical protein